MKKIVIFLSILFYIISSEEINIFKSKPINLLITKETHKLIIEEVETVASNINYIISQKNFLTQLIFSKFYLSDIKEYIINNMQITFSKLDISKNDTKLLTLVQDLIQIYQTNPYKIRYNLYKERIIQFLFLYGFPEGQYPIIILDSNIKNIITDFANNITQKCSKKGSDKCVNIELNSLYPLLPQVYSLIIQNSDLLEKITDMSDPQYTIDEKIIDFLNEKISNYSEIANQMETYFKIINNQCFKSQFRINNIEECVSPRIETIYNLIPFDLVETSDWIIDEFMSKLPSNNNMDKLVKIFLKLHIQKSIYNTLRLLNSDSYGEVICKWVISLFCLDDELCD